MILRRVGREEGGGKISVMSFSFLSPRRNNTNNNKKAVNLLSIQNLENCHLEIWIPSVICSILSEKEAFLRQCSLSNVIYLVFPAPSKET